MSDPDSERDVPAPALGAFAEKVSPAFRALIAEGAGGVARQVVESVEDENRFFPEELEDPISDAAFTSVRGVIEAGVPVVSQSVLLKGVNATFEDLAQGTAHFRIPLDDAIALMRRLRAELSGLCVPQLMIDLPGGHGKVSVGGRCGGAARPGNLPLHQPAAGRAGDGHVSACRARVRLRRIKNITRRVLEKCDVGE